MILIGQYDSPFVRRVAVTMNLYALPFQRRVLSVFADFDVMLSINPLGKVPVLELDDGERLFDSRAILDYLDCQMPPERRLRPPDEPHRHGVLRIETVALGLAEKLYERGFELARRAETKHDPMVIERVERQIASALAWLDALRPEPRLHGGHITQADVTAAIAFTYLRAKHAPLLSRMPCDTLASHCDHCEAIEAFAAAAYSASEAHASGWAPEPSATSSR